MKNWLLAAIFVVTWNQYELKLHDHYDSIVSYNDGSKPFKYDFPIPDGMQFYTVETTTHTIKLTTQKDVDLFVGEKVLIDPNAPPFGMSNPPSYTDDQYKFKPGLIGGNAFNIQVKQEGR